MNLKPNAIREKKLWMRMRPWWARLMNWPLLQTHRVRSLLGGVYRERPFAYSLYTLASPGQRVEVFAAQPSGIWWQRHSRAQLPA